MFESQDRARGGCGQRGLPSVVKRPLSRPPPPLAWPRGLAADEPPRHHSYRKADGQEPREVVRPDIDRVEMHREGEHHHRVLRARREGDNHVGNPKRKQRYNDQRKTTRQRRRRPQTSQRPPPDSSAVSWGSYSRILRL